MARRLDPEFDMWEASRPIVEASLRRELGPEGRISDFMSDLRRAQKTLKAMPEAADNMAALAKAWRAGEIDLSTAPTNTSNTKPRGLMKGFAWAGGGAVLLYFGLLAAGQI